MLQPCKAKAWHCTVVKYLCPLLSRCIIFWRVSLLLFYEAPIVLHYRWWKSSYPFHKSFSSERPNSKTSAYFSTACAPEHCACLPESSTLGLQRYFPYKVRSVKMCFKYSHVSCARSSAALIRSLTLWRAESKATRWPWVGEPDNKEAWTCFFATLGLKALLLLAT